MTAPRPGDVPLHKLFTPDEIEEIDNQPDPTAEGAIMPTPFRIGATREERLAALPPFPRDGRGKFIEQKLERLGNEALDAVSSIDTLLDELADEFAESFAREDARAAARARIDQTARDAKRRR